MTLATVEKLAVEAQKTRQTAHIDAHPLQAGVKLTSDGETFPLSSAQERLWYIHVLYPDVRASYNIQSFIPIDTNVNKIEAVLERFDDVLRFQGDISRLVACRQVC